VFPLTRMRAREAGKMSLIRDIVQGAVIVRDEGCRISSLTAIDSVIILAGALAGGPDSACVETIV
jgi:hypothetical protein